MIGVIALVAMKRVLKSGLAGSEQQHCHIFQRIRQVATYGTYFSCLLGYWVLSRVE